jgi:hypothetical protein
MTSRIRYTNKGIFDGDSECMKGKQSRVHKSLIMIRLD